MNFFLLLERLVVVKIHSNDQLDPAKNDFTMLFLDLWAILFMNEFISDVFEYEMIFTPPAPNDLSDS